MGEPSTCIPRVIGAGACVGLVVRAYLAVALGTSLRVPGARRVRHALVHCESREPPIVACARRPYTGRLDRTQKCTAVASAWEAAARSV